MIPDMKRIIFNISGFFRENIEKIQVRLERIPFVRFVLEVIKALGKDDAGIMAAGLSYYAFLSLFPLILGMVSVLGFFLPSEKVQEAVFEFLRQGIPVSTEVLEENIQYVIQIRSALGLVGIFGLLLGSFGIFSAVRRVVNRAWGVRPRPIHLSKPLEMAMLLGTGLLMILFFFISSGLSLLNQLLPFFPGGILLVFTHGVLFIITLGVLLLVYRYLPNTRVYWRDVWLGALIVAIMYHIVLFLFSIYVEHFTNYQIIYGSIGALIAILVWIYYSAFLFVLGAEINWVYSRLHGKSRRDDML
jgi:membrane protein